MDHEIAQLVEMGATAAQARSALRRYKDVMQAAEKIFDGEFDGAMDEDIPDCRTPSSSKVTARSDAQRMMTPEDESDFGGLEGSDSELNGDDDDDDDGDSYVDYDSDDGSRPMNVVNHAADPYAGIFFSKDRQEIVIEVEEDPEIVNTTDSPGSLRSLTQGQWMKGCPEGSEQSFLFSIYSGLRDGLCRCPGDNCTYGIERSQGDFFALYPTFAEYVDHVRRISRKSCPKCQTLFCFACGDKVTKEHDHNGRLTLDGNPLFHCANLQGVILGVGLTMLEQEFFAQLNQSTSPTVDGNSKKRKSKASADNAGTMDEEDDDEYYGYGLGMKGKKPKAVGIGYAGNRQEDMTGQNEALRAQIAKDKEIGGLLQQIREFLPNLNRSGGGKTSDYLPHPTTLAHLRRRFNFVSSALLRNDSLSDMSDRNVLYFELFEWLETISNHESLASMMAMPIMVPASVKAVNVRKSGKSQVRERTIVYEGSSGPRELLEAIVIQATAACKGLEGSPESQASNDQPMTEEEKRATGGVQNKKGKCREVEMEEKNGAQYSENKKLLEFCRRIIATADAIDRSLADTKGVEFVKRLKASLPKNPTFGRNGDETKEQVKMVGLDEAELRTIYVDWATHDRFDYCDLTTPPAPGIIVNEEYIPVYKHHFNSDIRLLGHAENPKRALAIAKELAVLTTNLPVAWDSSIFLRVDESRVDVLKALITGPPGTPYHNGCYLFDIFLGGSYNASPPSVKYMTTNSGKFRFNPNLYADGKVCLSLLGTWSGPGWNPGKSTLLQVLISIQSMILCDEPYLNEPGWANEHGTPASKAYSANVRRMVVNTAMLGNLKNPPEPFVNVIRTHFRLKAGAIKKQLDDWLKEDDARSTIADGFTAPSKVLKAIGSATQGSSQNLFKRDVEELKGLLNRLELEDAASSA